MKTKRAMLMKPRQIEVMEVDQPLGDDQVLIKVASCGLCNWELNYWKGILRTDDYPYPLGHEYAGWVVEVGKNVTQFKVGDKVINTHNEYHMPCFEYDEDGSLVESTGEIMVMNGDLGYVRYIKDTEQGVVMAVEFESGMAKISGGKMSNLLLGYAISIHKSQGSQAKVVIVVTDKIHKRMLTRNLLYVADSRARELLIEIGNVDAIEEGLERQENKDRDTWLKEMMEEWEDEN